MRLLLDSQSGGPSAAGQPDNNGYGEGNLDSNMVIILAALLCALVFALGLNSIVRCALRCSRRIAFESPDSVAAHQLAMTGIKKSRLREIPVAVYGSAGADNIPATECPICLAEFVDGEKVRVLPKCQHGFHVTCIDIWLASHSSCPTCRQSLQDHQAAAGIAEAGVRPQAAAGNESGGHPQSLRYDEHGIVQEVA